MQQQLHSIDLTVLIIYVSALVLFALYFMKRNVTAKDFMSAGGRLPSWAVGLSIFGTYLSSNTFIGVPGKSFASNWNFFVFSLTLPICAYIACKFFVPFYREGKEISAYHHLEKKFGPGARTYGVICYLLTQIARMGTIMFGVSLSLVALTGWNIQTIIIVTGVLVTLYTLLGGIEAVIWTDVIQSIILIIGALVITGILIFDMPEGPAQAFNIANAHSKFSLGSFQLDFSISSFWVVFLFGMFINLNNFGIDQSFIQRYHTAKSVAEAKKSVWMGALLYVPISLVFFLIGSLLFSYYSARPELLAELTAGGESISDIGDKVLPHFIMYKLPTGLAGLLIAAIFSAAMSSIDTSLNSCSTITLEDLFKRYSKTSIDEQKSQSILKYSTVGWGIVATCAALLMINAKSILSLWWKLQGALAAGVLGLFLLGAINKTKDSMHSLSALVCGIICIIWVSFGGSFNIPRSPFHGNMAIVLGTCSILLMGLLLNRGKSSKNP